MLSVVQTASVDRRLIGHDSIDSLFDRPLLVFISLLFARSSQYTIQTSACGQNILSTVDEANVKEKVLVKQGNQEGRFRGRRA